MRGDKSECQHGFFQPNTTIHLFKHNAYGMWWAGCRVCKRHTDPCLLKEEAVARARTGWWAK